MQPTDDTTDFQERWGDDALITAAAFANHRGGTLWIGLREDGSAPGCPVDSDALRTVGQQLEALGLSFDVVPERRGEADVLRVIVRQCRTFTVHTGKTYRRRGVRNLELNEQEILFGMPGALGRTVLIFLPLWLGVFLAALGLLLVLAGTTSIIAWRAGDGGLGTTESVIWLIATGLILVLCLDGLCVGFQKRYGPWRFLPLLVALVMLVSFALEGVPEWRTLGIWPFERSVEQHTHGSHAPGDERHEPLGGDTR